jgi:hypothetical protein
LRPRRCNCKQPLRDLDTCFLCGRTISNAPEPALIASVRDGRENPWTQAGVIRAIKTFTFFLGRPPCYADWRYDEQQREFPSSSTVVALFGSFSAALTSAGAATPLRAA